MASDAPRREPPSPLDQRKLVAAALWNAFGATQYGVEVAYKTPLWDAVTKLGPAAFGALQKTCLPTPDREIIIEATSKAPEFASIYSALLAVYGRCVGLQHKFAGGSPPQLEPITPQEILAAFGSTD